MCIKNELTEQCRDEGIIAINKLMEKEEWAAQGGKALLKVRSIIANDSMIGEEAKYLPKKVYVPDWKTGDVFTHKISTQIAAKFNLIGDNYIVLRKIGELIDFEGQHRQLLHVAISDHCPLSSEDINCLNYISMSSPKEYMAQVIVKSKRAEEGYQLSKVGYFPEAMMPQDRKEEDPYVSCPLWGYDKKTGIVDYEDQVCRIAQRRWNAEAAKGIFKQ